MSGLKCEKLKKVSNIAYGFDIIQKCLKMFYSIIHTQREGTETSIQ